MPSRDFSLGLTEIARDVVPQILGIRARRSQREAEAARFEASQAQQQEQFQAQLEQRQKEQEIDSLQFRMDTQVQAGDLDGAAITFKEIATKSGFQGDFPDIREVNKHVRAVESAIKKNPENEESARQTFLDRFNIRPLGEEARQEFSLGTQAPQLPQEPAGLGLGGGPFQAGIERREAELAGNIGLQKQLTPFGEAETIAGRQLTRPEAFEPSALDIKKAETAATRARGGKGPDVPIAKRNAAQKLAVKKLGIQDQSIVEALIQTSGLSAIEALEKLGEKGIDENLFFRLQVETNKILAKTLSKEEAKEFKRQLTEGEQLSVEAVVLTEKGLLNRQFPPAESKELTTHAFDRKDESGNVFQVQDGKWVLTKRGTK